MNAWNSFDTKSSCQSRYRKQSILSSRKNIRTDFWNTTIIDDYNFLMSEELISQCKNSLSEPFYSYNDLLIHHVSYNDYEKQYLNFFDWCTKNYQLIERNSSNTLTCYLRQKSYEDLYEQGLVRLRTFDQYSKKIIERFADLQIVVDEKMKKITGIWTRLERRLIDYFDEDFDRIIQELHKELILFERWMDDIEDQLETIQDCQQVLKIQHEIKSKNTSVSTLLEICERLKIDYKPQLDRIPFDYAYDLENRWHQIWIYSLEIQCKLEERFQCSSSSLINNDNDDDEEDIIPFNSSEYEKISLASSKSCEIDQTSHLSSFINRKRRRSPVTLSIKFNRQMAKSKRRLSLNVLPNHSPSVFYYSLTNIDDDNSNNDDDDDHHHHHHNEKQTSSRKKFKVTSSKFDIGYASEDALEKSIINPMRKTRSDTSIHSKASWNLFSSSLTHSLPLFDHQSSSSSSSSWEHSTTSAYETSSNPDIDRSLDETKKTSNEPSLAIYRRKYTQSPVISHSYDASVEYTDGDQSENDVDLSTSIPIHHYGKGESLVYNRYATTTTTTTGYSSDVEPNSSIQSEPCWDGYQNPLYTQEIDSMESTLKWDEQFLDDENFTRLIHKNNGSLLSIITHRQQEEEQEQSDSDIDDLNDVINETDRQLIKTRQILTKKKTSRLELRIHDELLRTCQTNIECLERILSHLHQSTHSRLHNTRVIQLFQTYLSHWYEMQEQVYEDRRRIEQFTQLNHRIEQLEEHFHARYSSSTKHFPSLIALRDDLLDQLKDENHIRIELSHLINQYPDGPLNEHFLLHQSSTKIDQYHLQLQTLLNRIEKLLPIENQLEQKLITFTNDYPNDLLELQTLIDQYARLIPSNILQNYCQTKLKDFRRMFEKHVLQQSMNVNNNNSSTTTTIERIKFAKQRDEIRDVQEHFTTHDSSLPQTSSSTSSYISDDCKVLYIETVIEVNKPVFYERTTNICGNMSDSNQNSFDHTMNHRPNPPPSDSTDEEISNHPKSSPVPSSTTNGNYRGQVNGNYDSGLHNASSARRRFDEDQLLFPSTDHAFEETSQPTLARRLEQQRLFDNANQRYPPRRRIILQPAPTVRSLPRNYFRRALTYGLFVLFLLLLIYFCFLDRCSQIAVETAISRRIIRIESTGLPTF